MLKHVPFRKFKAAPTFWSLLLVPISITVPMWVKRVSYLVVDSQSVDPNPNTFENTFECAAIKFYGQSNNVYGGCVM